MGPHSHTLLLAFTLVATTVATMFDDDPWPMPKDFNRYDPIKNGITWNSCGGPYPVECGRFEVPMDYQNASAGKASLAVARLSATKTPKLGTLFTNPGGPGQAGATILLYFSGEALMKATGGRYDIVSWDPRGVWSTFPRATCFSTEKDERKLLGGSPMLESIEMRVDIASAKEDLARFINQSSSIDTQLAEVGKRCTEYSPDVMQYVGTVATVRDMVSLHDYLVPSNKTINYWGFSYGTIIGMYFANMFPERVGRLILDAVVHPEHWANQPPHKSWEYSIMTANISLAGFVSECVKAGPTRCNFTMENDSETKLRQRLVGLFNRAYDWKKSNASSPFGSGPLRQYIHREMYAPEQWPKLASGLASYDKRLPPAATSDYFLPGSSTIATLVGLKKTINIDAYNQEEDLGVVEYSQQAITCADAIDNHSNVTTKEVLEEVARVAQKYPIFGPMWSSVLYCHRWPVRAVERYTGPWYRSPSNKILIIGTEGDPITPFKWTKEVATSYGSAHAALVEQEDYGHPSTAMRSNCTSNIILNYLINNTLPDLFSTVCKTNDILFPEPHSTQDLHGADNQRNRQFSIGTAFGCALILVTVYLITPHKLPRVLKAEATKISYSRKMIQNTDTEQGSKNAPLSEPQVTIG